MQDGRHGHQFELTASGGQSTRIGFSASSESYGNASSQSHISSSRRPCPSMPYGSETWSHSSIPLSILTNGGCIPAAGTQLGHGRNSPLPQSDNGEDGNERVAKISSSNSSSSALKERDYIGLSDSSSTSLQGSNFTATTSEEKRCSKANFGLDSKDTELRLGLGLSLVDQGDASEGDALKDGPPRPRTMAEAKFDCNLVEYGTSKTCGIKQSSLPEQKQVPTFTKHGGKVSLEQCFSGKDGNSGSISEKMFGSLPHGAIGSHISRDSYKMQWNDEQYLLNQRASPLPTSLAADNTKLSVLERYGSEAQLTDLNRIAKENSVSLSAPVLLNDKFSCREEMLNSLQHNDLPMLEAPHGNGHTLPPRSMKCNRELLFAPHDSMAETDQRGFNSIHAVQMTWQNQMSLPNEGLRTSSAQNGTISELDAGSKACDGFSRGAFMIPAPKVHTVPAKRPYFEAIGDSRMTHANEMRSDPRANVSVLGATANAGINPAVLGTSTMDGEMKSGMSQSTKVHPASGLFSWNNVIQLPAGWQIGVEQSKGMFSPIVAAKATLPPRVQAPPELKTASAPGSESAKESLAKAPAFPAKQANTESHNGDGGSRAPVVGWPPIRSFRKNTLASQKPQADQEQDPRASPTDATEQGKQPSSTTLYVKANMDGVPIGRKVDLKFYDSYESLKLALQDMFQRFTNGPTALGMECASKSEHKKLNLSDGTDYVLTHEDKDGDWMLVGDVPWNMFVTTVKRLRIMKVSEAIGLGPRVSSKLKIQANNQVVEGARSK